MSPGILVGALLSGEGPDSLAADEWVAGRLCLVCITYTNEATRLDDDGLWVHPSCAQDTPIGWLHRRRSHPAWSD